MGLRGVGRRRTGGRSEQRLAGRPSPASPATSRTRAGHPGGRRRCIAGDWLPSRCEVASRKCWGAGPRVAAGRAVPKLRTAARVADLLRGAADRGRSGRCPHPTPAAFFPKGTAASILGGRDDRSRPQPSSPVVGYQPRGSLVPHDSGRRISPAAHYGTIGPYAWIRKCFDHRRNPDLLVVILGGPVPTSGTGPAALLVIDALNDSFGAEDAAGPRTSGLPATSIASVMEAARGSSLLVVHVPHRRWAEGAIDHWQRPTPEQLEWDQAGRFEEAGWGGRWPAGLEPVSGDVVAHEHHGNDGFADTDLELHLRQRGIRRLFLTCGASSACLPGTASFAMSRGFHVTVLAERDGAGSLSGAAPRFAHAIMSVQAFTRTFRRCPHEV